MRTSSSKAFAWSTFAGYPSIRNPLHSSISNMASPRMSKASFYEEKMFILIQITSLNKGIFCLSFTCYLGIAVSKKKLADFQRTPTTSAVCSKKLLLTWKCFFWTYVRDVFFFLQHLRNN